MCCPALRLRTRPPNLTALLLTSMMKLYPFYTNTCPISRDEKTDCLREPPPRYFCHHHHGAPFHLLLTSTACVPLVVCWLFVVDVVVIHFRVSVATTRTLRTSLSLCKGCCSRCRRASSRCPIPSLDASTRWARASTTSRSRSLTSWSKPESRTAKAAKHVLASVYSQRRQHNQ